MLPQTADLPTLLQAIARGDHRALRELYHCTGPKLLGVISRIVRDGATAEDILQDVYLRVWQNAGTYSAEAAKPMTWLIAIARNRSIDVVRQRREILVPPAEDGTDWYASIPEGRDRESEYADIQRLRVCLGRMDAVQRSCLLDAYYEGFSREELASRYDRPVNTIKTWLHRSASGLRACLDEP